MAANATPMAKQATEPGQSKRPIERLAEFERSDSALSVGVRRIPLDSVGVR